MDHAPWAGSGRALGLSPPFAGVGSRHRAQGPPWCLCLGCVQLTEGETGEGGPACEPRGPGRSLLPGPSTSPCQPHVLKAPRAVGQWQLPASPALSPPSASPKPRRAVVPTTAPSRPPLLPPWWWQGKQSFRKVGTRSGCPPPTPGKLLRTCRLLDVGFQFRGRGSWCWAPFLFLRGSSLAPMPSSS